MNSGPDPDPPVYKHLNAKTAGILQVVNRHQRGQGNDGKELDKEEAGKETTANKNNMAATEQT